MHLLGKLCQGMLAGLAGSAAMYGFRLWWEVATKHQEQHAIFGFDHEADVNGARFLAHPLRGALPEAQAARLGIGLHYAYGAMLGSLYAPARDRSARFGRVNSVPFGVVLWLCADEIPVALSGISNPFRKSAASHAGALLAHVVFATTVENALRLLQRRSGPSC